MNQEVHVIDKYMLANKLPHMWCSGCGNGIVLNSLIRAIDRTDVNQDDIILVAGIGCSSRANGYTDFCGLHTNHGRAIAYASGVKMHNPKLKVIVVTGDGDCTSIGGNHFIHACRRNIDMTVVVFNNNNYGMTGGQYSPTTPIDSKTKTSVYGNIEPPFDVCNLAKSAGATYVARSTTYNVNALTNYLEKAINHNGFSVVEAICDCPTLYGKNNKLGDATAMLKLQKEASITIEKAQQLSEEELIGKIVVGEFINNQTRQEYTSKYEQLIEKVKEAN